VPLFCHCFAAAKDKICFINTSWWYAPLFSLSFLDVYGVQQNNRMTLLHNGFTTLHNTFKIVFAIHFQPSSFWPSPDVKLCEMI
jgi:hypothetical protein